MSRPLTKRQMIMQLRMLADASAIEERNQKVAPSPRPKIATIYRRTCACGEVFVTTSSNAIWCTACRKRGSSRHRDRLTVAAGHRHRRALEHNAPGSHTESEWRAKLKSQRWRCFYCFCDMTSSTWTRDHKIPLSRGGSDSIQNIVAACRTCNLRKATKTASEFMEYVETIIQKQPSRASNSVEKQIEALQKEEDRKLDALWKKARKADSKLWRKRK